MNQVQEIVKRNKAGREVGIYSCCSANRDVVKAALLKAKKTKTFVLIEATSNQVNQFGGYTGMMPEDFRHFVFSLAKEVGLSASRIVLGGDHLGPLPWMQENEKEAMEKAAELVRSYVLAGYSKIHLDTSMRLGSDDPLLPLDASICAKRGALLCKEAEEAFRQYRQGNPEAEPPVYVLGSEVPVPGGGCSDDAIGVTTVESCADSLEKYKIAFVEEGLQEVFDRVVAYVVEMGVEFHEYILDEYNQKKARDLSEMIQKEKLAIEAHSTDYQTVENLSRMCKDGCAILKVGPAFTFSLREGLFSMEGIEQRLFKSQPEKLSNFRKTLEAAMLADDAHWKSYYKGSEDEQAISRAYSFLDRSRYYLQVPSVMEAREKLLSNLSDDVIPLCMLSQYMPNQYYRIRVGEIKNNAEEILLDKIGDRIDDYLVATKNNGEL